jgi:Glutathione-dependent formaldehyde-activating enzyme
MTRIAFKSKRIDQGFAKRSHPWSTQSNTGVNNMTAPYTGGCQCGSVRYDVTMEPIRLLTCHCKECQRQSGSAFAMSMPVKKDASSLFNMGRNVPLASADRPAQLIGVSWFG